MKDGLAAQQGARDAAAELRSRVRAERVPLVQILRRERVGRCEIHQSEIGIVAGRDSAFAGETEARGRSSGGHAAMSRRERPRA